jgi:hypothetical protein
MHTSGTPDAHQSHTTSVNRVSGPLGWGVGQVDSTRQATVQGVRSLGLGCRTRQGDVSDRVSDTFSRRPTLQLSPIPEGAGLDRVSDSTMRNCRPGGHADTAENVSVPPVRSLCSDLL